jgi:hypothetical protein
MQSSRPQRLRSIAPASDTQSQSNVVPFKLRRRPPPRGIEGLFWAMPKSWQRRRIAELARSLPPELVAAITRRPACESWLFHIVRVLPP